MEAVLAAVLAAAAGRRQELQAAATAAASSRDRSSWFYTAFLKSVSWSVSKGTDCRSRNAFMLTRAASTPRDGSPRCAAMAEGGVSAAKASGCTKADAVETQSEGSGCTKQRRCLSREGK